MFVVNHDTERSNNLDETVYVMVRTRGSCISSAGAKRGCWGGGEAETARTAVKVWCGCAVQCIVGRVEVQWCCHGDTLRQSVLVLGVTECKSAYAGL